MRCDGVGVCARSDRVHTQVGFILIVGVVIDCFITTKLLIPAWMHAVADCGFRNFYPGENDCFGLCWESLKSKWQSARSQDVAHVAKPQKSNYHKVPTEFIF